MAHASCPVSNVLSIDPYTVHIGRHIGLGISYARHPMCCPHQQLHPQLAIYQASLTHARVSRANTVEKKTIRNIETISLIGKETIFLCVDVSTKDSISVILH